MGKECVSHMSHGLATGHHTHILTPEACEGADMYAACAYYPVFNVALGNTRPD